VSISGSNHASAKRSSRQNCEYTGNHAEREEVYHPALNIS